MVNKNFPVGYAANFDAVCHFCIYDAKVRKFLELCKLFADYFSIICEIFNYSFIQIRQEGF